jgi:hypothetical protein
MLCWVPLLAVNSYRRSQLHRSQRQSPHDSRSAAGGGKRILRAARWQAERLVERSSQKTVLRSMRLERNHAASRRPLANNSSATSTANEAPTTRPTIPTFRPASEKVSSSVWSQGQRKRFRFSRLAKGAQNVSVAIQQTHRRHLNGCEVLLTPRLARQSRRYENRR